MMTASALSELMRCADEAGIAVISDEIYHGLDYAFAAESAARLASDVIIVNSFSKYFCMTGWRIGWMVVPSSLVRAVERLQQNFAISVPTLSQIAAEAAFEGRLELEAVRRSYEENRRILLDGLPRAGFDSFPPGRWRVLSLCRHLPLLDRQPLRSQPACSKRRAWPRPRASISIRTAERNFLRLSYAGSANDMREAVERIGDWLRRI